jgi:hypothetical protein
MMPLVPPPSVPSFFSPTPEETSSSDEDLDDPGNEEE